MQASPARRHVRRADVRVADWLVQPSVNRISRGDEVVHLRPKLMDVLVFLAGRPGEVITKDELLEAVWPQLFVEESALARVIADLRQLLGDDAHRPAIIETIPKRGYRLIASVDEDGPVPGASRSSVVPLPFAAPAFAGRRTPGFVGREEQMARLTAMLDAACKGAGSATFVTGEVGTGKTALLSEFTRRAQHSLHDLVVAQGKAAMPGAANDPYATFRQVLALVTGDVEAPLAAGALDIEQAERLWRLIPCSVRVLTDVAPDLIDTLVPAAALVARARMAAASRGACDWVTRLEQCLVCPGAAQAAEVAREDLISEAIALFQTLSRQYPLLIVLDDLQWADQASVGLLWQLANEAPRHRILVVGAYRPADVAGVPDGVRHPLEAPLLELVRRFGDVTIPLPEQGDQAFVDGLIDAEPNALGPDFRRTLLGRTRGHPLFTVELLRAMRHGGALVQDASGCWQEGASLNWDALPVRVEAAVAERVGRLPRTVRRFLEVASIEGEEFTAEIVARVAGVPEQEAVLTLGDEIDRRHRLARLQSVRRVNGGWVSTYRFEHVVTQRYLAASLDQAQRLYLHEAVGKALEALHGSDVAEIATRLAWHFEQARDVPQAIEYLRQAGERAMRLSADEEAVTHFAAAIALLGQVPQSRGADAEELRLQLALLLPLVRLTHGIGSALAPAMARLHNLCDRLPAGGDTFSAATALMLYHAMRGEYGAAIDAADRCTATAARLAHPALVALSRWLPGAFRLRTGELGRSRGDLDYAVADGVEIGSQIAAGFVHPEVWRLCWLGYCLWFLGYPDQALACERRAVSFAEALGDRSALCLALGAQASVLLHRGEGAAAQQALDTVLQTGVAATDFLRVSVPFLQGWSLVQTGQVEDGLGCLERLVAAVHPLPLRLDWTKFKATLASALLKAGRTERAEAAVREARETAAATGEHYYDAELSRLQGEVALAASGARAEAERCFGEAIGIARRQEARSWELRAATSLARLWASEGRAADAHAALSPVYSWFTEGYETRDLQSARELLRNLG